MTAGRDQSSFALRTFDEFGVRCVRQVGGVEVGNDLVPISLMVWRAWCRTLASPRADAMGARQGWWLLLLPWAKGACAMWLPLARPALAWRRRFPSWRNSR